MNGASVVPAILLVGLLVSYVLKKIIERGE